MTFLCREPTPPSYRQNTEHAFAHIIACKPETCARIQALVNTNTNNNNNTTTNNNNNNKVYLKVPF